MVKGRKASAAEEATDSLGALRDSMALPSPAGVDRAEYNMRLLVSGVVVIAAELEALRMTLEGIADHGIATHGQARF